MVNKVAVIGGVLAILGTLTGLLNSVGILRFSEPGAASWTKRSWQMLSLTLLLVFSLGGWLFWLGANPRNTLTVQVWDVGGLERTLVASRRANDRRTTEEKLREAARESIAIIRQVRPATAAEVTLHVEVPTDLGQGLRVTMEPKGEFAISYRPVGATGAERFVPSHADDPALAMLGQDFYLEIDRVGYSPWVKRIPWERAESLEFDYLMKPKHPGQVRVVVEEVHGDDTLQLADDLETYLREEASKALGTGNTPIVDTNAPGHDGWLVILEIHAECDSAPPTSTNPAAMISSQEAQEWDYSISGTVQVVA